jgi:hypothetical protein
MKFFFMLPKQWAICRIPEKVFSRVLENLWAVCLANFTLLDNFGQIINVGKLSILPKALHHGKILVHENFRAVFEILLCPVISSLSPLPPKCESS